MTDYVFPPPVTPSLAVMGSAARFPIRRVWCVGRNYLAHVRELGNDTREPPFFFSKQPDMVVPEGGVVRYPSLTENFQYEVELVVALKAGGENIPEDETDGLIFGHAVGLDLTRRDLQKAAQEKGKPWEIGKSFEQAAPIGPVTPASAALRHAAIRLWVDDAIRQDSDIDRMVWNVPEILARLSQQVRLAPGDLIFTGTPQGVGPLKPGNRVRAEIAGLEPVAITIA